MDDDVTYTLELPGEWNEPTPNRWETHWRFELRKWSLCKVGRHKPVEHAMNTLGTAEVIWACVACGRVEGWIR